MKGIIFSGFLEMIEEKHGLPLLQKIIDESDLDTKGVYSSIGTYESDELHKLLDTYAAFENIPRESILEEYGQYFFKTLQSSYYHFIKDQTLFSFIISVDNYIHPEVHKLYPEAELPKFNAVIEDDNTMLLQYSSTRKMSSFAKGLILQAATFYNTVVSIKTELFVQDGEQVHFRIRTNDH